jgi:hypothetical protein
MARIGMVWFFPARVLSRRGRRTIQRDTPDTPLNARGIGALLRQLSAAPGTSLPSGNTLTIKAITATIRLRKSQSAMICPEGGEDVRKDPATLCGRPDWLDFHFGNCN